MEYGRATKEVLASPEIDNEHSLSALLSDPEGFASVRLDVEFAAELRSC
jgi:hypothetical protein